MNARYAAAVLASFTAVFIVAGFMRNHFLLLGDTSYRRLLASIAIDNFWLLSPGPSPKAIAIVAVEVYLVTCHVVGSVF